MDSARLKKEFGKDLTFWGGGCDPVVMGTGTVQEVRDDVQRRIHDFAPGGGSSSVRPQHPGERAPGKHRGHVRRRGGVGWISDPCLNAPHFDA